MLDTFTKKYPLSKTLRFELKPVAETANLIEDFKSSYLRGVVSQDKERAEHYKEVKEIIDNYHRAFIESSLRNLADMDTGELFITPDDFEDAYSYFQKLRDQSGDLQVRDEWESTQAVLRKNLVKAFVGKADLFKKELITRDLPNWLKEQGKWDQHQAAVESFMKFTTYFTGLHENRKNMYTDEAQVTAIAFRLINENLPRFFSNCMNYQRIQKHFPGLDFTPESDLMSKMGVTTLGEVFTPGYFLNLTTQTGIDNFQELLGGKTINDGTKIQGLNETINLYRQKNQLKARDLPGFSVLYKQILSDRESHSFIPDVFENDRQLLEAVEHYIRLSTGEDGFIDQLKQSLVKLDEADPARVYMKSAGINDVSSAIFGNYSIIKNAISHYAENVAHPAPANGNISTALERKRSIFADQEVFSISDLDNILLNYIEQIDESDPLRHKLPLDLNRERLVSDYFTGSLVNIRDQARKVINLETYLDNKIMEVKGLFPLEELSRNRSTPKSDDDEGGRGYQQTRAIQQMLDAFMLVAHVVKPLHLVKGRKPIDMPDMDTGFYTRFSSCYETYSQATISLYNKTRNHLTKKPFSRDKIKINFESPTLLEGWDVNKETANVSVLFEKNGLYYLGVMHPKHKKLFDYVLDIDDEGSAKKKKDKEDLYKKIVTPDGECYRKVVYKLLPGPNKMLPKVFFSNKRQDYFSPSEEVLRIRNTASHSKNGSPQKGYKKANFDLDDCHTIIDFFKKSINRHTDWKKFDFRFSPTCDYKDLSDFYREVAQQGYRVDFHRIKSAYIDQCVAEGKLFLFQIYNKDFSPFSKGRPNLHTIFWKGLFEQENLEDVVLKLNGESEIFFRQHSIRKDEATVHPRRLPINNKNENNHKRTSKFEYDIIKDRRYTQDKFLFHVPITLNYKAAGTPRFNDFVNRRLAQEENTHVIGLDRGERHLLYFTVINQSGEIVEQDTLNEIQTDQGYAIDYHQKLHQKEKQREAARKSWSTVENIKELKQGYLSSVVHKLASLIVRYNAIVCLEDLNFGFKRGRFKVEKQVYQKFEKALIDKLNYLVFKERGSREPGGYLNAYQLTAGFQSFEKLGKQSGILFYVPASYTSKIDPATGFIDFLNPKYESLSKAKVFFERLDAFRYNAQQDYFECAFDYKTFTPTRKLGSYRSSWTICTHGDTRYHNRRNKSGVWETVKVNVTEEIKKLFEDEGITYRSGDDLREMLALVKSTKFYKSLFYLLRVALALRHSVTGTSEDFILSPVADSNGLFFDSRNAGDLLPRDADANGAYHIALKGLWNLQKIREWDDQKKLNLAMKNEDWLTFIQTKPYRQ